MGQILNETTADPRLTDLAALRTLAAMPHPMAGVCGVAADEIARLRRMVDDFSAVPFRCDKCRSKLSVSETLNVGR